MSIYCYCILIIVNKKLNFHEIKFRKKFKVHVEYIKYVVNRYNVQWYKAPVKIQKLLLFIMQSTTTPYVINVGNLIMASVEGFAKVEGGDR